MLKLGFKKVHIKQKLIIINLLTIGFALLLNGSALLLNVFVSFRTTLVQNLTTQANILSNDCAAPLTFNDQKTAVEDLRTLKASPNIKCAIIYGRNGKVFAEYRRAGSEIETPPIPPQEDGHQFYKNNLQIFQTIELDREKIGRIYLSSDLVQFHSLMIHYGVIAFMTMAFVFGISFLLLTRLQRVISEPIFDLANSMQIVSRSRDYTHKAIVNNEDEIGFLANGFNEMLEHIRERDMKLLSEIAERKQAEERLSQAKEEWERTFDAIVDPVMIADSQHKIIKANKAMAAKLGISQDDAEGLECYNTVHGTAAPPLFCPHTELLSDGLPHSVEIFEERLGGHFIVSVSPLFTPHGEVYGSVHYARDITERKLAEESVQRINEELEQKIQERTRQLLDAQEELVRKEKLAILGQLSGSVGHELRNPLGVMSNAIYFLKTVMPDADETVKEYLDMIKNEIDNSQRIITDLLDFSRTKSPQTKAVQAIDLVHQSLGKCSVPENIQLQTILPDMLSALYVDPLQMIQVFQNLITNAVQAMPDGGSLRISARSVQSSKFKVQAAEETNREDQTLYIEHRTDFVEISIQDTGEGISPEGMKKLFQPLYTTKAKGIGLGLTVCKNLVEANGGHIEVESRCGAGTTFTVSMPVFEG